MGTTKQIRLVNQSRGAQLAHLLLLDEEAYRALQKTHMIPGSLTFAQGVLLYILAKQYNFPGARIINIGTKYGLSTAYLACGAPQAQVVSIEPVAGRVRKARQNLKRFSNVEVWAGKSWEYLEMHLKHKPDMVFLDGCHRQIAQDIPYFDQLRRGGLFMSHDYVPWKFPYVVKAMDKLRDRLGKEQFDVALIDKRGRGMVGVYHP
jgi:predicted O-methyltransferase YrrM